MPLRSAIILTSLLLVLVPVLIGCGLDTPAVTSPVISETVSPMPTGPEQTDTPAPTVIHETITESAALSGVILISPSGADPDLTNLLESILTELASAEDLDFEVRATLTPRDLDPTVQLVVVVAPDPGLESLAAAAPQVQFLSIGIPGITAAGNIHTLASQGPPGDQIGFLAGYLAAMVTPEWRVGVIAPSDTPAGVSARQGFMNGVVYFCGLCRQTYPPYFTYPLYAELPSTASSADWQSAAQVLVDQSVQTVYVAPGAENETLLTYLGQAGVELIGNDPPPIGLREQWIASIQADLATAIRDTWSTLLAGEGASAIPVSLSVNHINDEILTPGRLRLLEEMVANLESGFIDPISNSAGDGD